MNIDLDFTVIKTKKAVINSCYGGFFLSKKAILLYDKYLQESGVVLTPEQQRSLDHDLEKARETESFYFGCEISRDDPILVRVVEELKEQANGGCSKLRIEQIRDEPGWDFIVREYDGIEWIEEFFITKNGKWTCTVSKRQESI